MAESEYRQRQIVSRLFGPHAVLTGSIGSARGPGHVDVLLDGRLLGRGQTFGQALQDASTKLRGGGTRCSQVC